MKKLAFTLLISSAFVACQQENDNTQEAELVSKSTASYSVYGDTIQAEGSVNVAELPVLLAGTQDDSVKIKVSAEAINSCKMKGCFMNVKLPDDEQMRVSFRDYSFFVPKDLEGEQVIFEGVAFRSLTSVETLKHMAEDAGASQAAIDSINEPKVEYRFIADGVLIAEN